MLQRDEGHLDWTLTMHRSVVDNWTADTTQELAACVTVCLQQEARCGEAAGAGSRIPELAGQLFSED